MIDPGQDPDPTEDDNERRLSVMRKELDARETAKQELNAVKSAMQQELDAVKAAKLSAEGKISDLKSTGINLQAEAASRERDLSRQIEEEMTRRKQAERDIQGIRISFRRSKKRFSSYGACRSCNLGPGGGEQVKNSIRPADAATQGSE